MKLKMDIVANGASLNPCDGPVSTQTVIYLGYSLRYILLQGDALTYSKKNPILILNVIYFGHSIISFDCSTTLN